MATPAVQALREAFPDAKLTMLTKPRFSDFWKAFPGVNQVKVLESEGHGGLGGSLTLVRELKREAYDLALLFPSSFSSALSVFLAGIPERVGFSAEGRDFLLTKAVAQPHPRQRHQVWEFLRLVSQGLEAPFQQATARLVWPEALLKAPLQAFPENHQIESAYGLIALAPGATYGPAKRWPLPFWISLVQKLLEERAESLLILGGEEEKEYLGGLSEAFAGKDPRKRIHSLAGETSLASLGWVLSRCQLLITNDTGPMHVAAAVGTPTVALFGSTSPVWTRPFGQGHRVLTKNLECSPCFQRSCPIGLPCLKQITVAEVLEAVRERLQRARRTQPEAVPAGVLD